jgi:hypothetical protein
MGEILTYILLISAVVNFVGGLVSFGKARTTYGKAYALGMVLYYIMVGAVCGYALGWWL